jgi:hypothetical protein
MPGSTQWHPPYVPATVVGSVAELESIRGYAILDDFGLRMLANTDIRRHLLDTPPCFETGGSDRLYVWRLGKQ